jgi:hypothetical protein
VRGVLAVAVRRFDQDEVAVADRRRVVQDRRVAPPEIAGEHDRGRGRSIRDAQLDDRRAEDVARVAEGGLGAIEQVHLRVVGDRLELGHGLLDVGHGIEGGARHRHPLGRRSSQLGGHLRVVLDGRLLARELGVVGRRVVRVLLAPAVLGLFLQLGGVAQDDLGEVGGAAGGVDRSSKAGLDEGRDAPAMVEMGVCQEHRVEGLGIVGKGHSIAAHLFWRALEHAAVDEDLALTSGDQELRAGDGPDGPQELDRDAHRGEYGRNRVAGMIGPHAVPDRAPH